MVSIGDDDDEMKSAEKDSDVDHSDTETQPFDSQFSPSSLYGDKLGGEYFDELQFLQNTMPFHDTVPLEEEFETQVVNLGGETQVANLAGETQEVNLFGETQIVDDPEVNLFGETQILDDPECVINEDTQLLDEFNNEVSVNSDSEDTDRTEVLVDSDESSDEVSKAGEDALSNGMHNSELFLPAATPSNKVTLDLKTGTYDSGSPRRGFTSIRTASLRASGLAARRKASVEVSSGSCRVKGKSLNAEEHSGQHSKSNVSRESSISQEEIDLDYSGQYKEQSQLGSENKCKVGSSTVRRLFTENTSMQSEGPGECSKNTDGGSSSPRLLAYDNEMAGLSYVDSQEPGDLSQANALDFIDKFLKTSVTDFDLGVNLGSSILEKDKHVSSAKGTQSLAKRANFRDAAEGRAIFDWDDSREDEGGGEFFSKRKELFYDDACQRQKHITVPQKPKDDDFKGSGKGGEFGHKEKGLEAHEKDQELVHSRLKKDRNYKTARVKETKSSNNLIKELDKQFLDASNEMGTSNCNKDAEDMLNVRFDTQMAAEAMEALCNGVVVDGQDCVDANQSARSMSDGSPEEETICRPHTKENGFHRASSTNCRGIKRSSNIKKRADSKLSRDSSVSLQNQARNANKQPGNDMNGAKANSKEDFNTSVRKNLHKVSSKVSKQRKEERVVERSDIDYVDGCHSAASLTGHSSIKKQRLHEQNSFTPIACRTRKRRETNQSKKVENTTKSEREDLNNLKEVGSFKLKRKRSSTVNDAFEMSNGKEKSIKLGSKQSGELENVKSTQHKHPERKVIDKAAAIDTDELRYPKGRRSQRKPSALGNGIAETHALSKQSTGQEANGHSIPRLKRSKIDAVFSDLGVMRQTRSSSHANPVFFSLDTSTDQRLTKQVVNKGGSGNAANKNSSDKTGNATSMHSCRKDCIETVSSAEAGGNDVESETLPEGCKLSTSSCVTPVNCTTPVNAASPVCMGDEYLKQSCRKNLAKFSLTREINSLVAVEPESISAVKDCRKRRDLANVRVLFSHHLEENIVKQQKKILARLGASESSSISDATHFVTDKFVRTRNMLEAIASGKPVVTHLWIESCGQASCFLDERKYILNDAKKEKEFGFSLPVSLARAVQHPLLQGRKVFITPNTKPGKELLANLVKAVHGVAVERLGRSALKDAKIPDDLLVLSCEEDYEICVPFLEKGASVYSSELLLNGIVTQKLEYERHRLFVDHVKRTRSTIWQKKDTDQFLPVNRSK